MEHIFRQWCKRNQTFYYWGFDLPEELQPHPDYFTGPRLVDMDNPHKKYLPSEQYVGFKDKDGQLVFVGDRVQFTKNTNFTIIWDKERCGFYGIDDNGVDYLITCLVHMIKEHGVGKVIGHIHQEKS